MNPTETNTLLDKRIYPVILSVPEDMRCLKGRERVRQLSRHARRALRISAAKSCVRLGSLSKDTAGVPIPFEGTHWSLTHKPAYVGAVVASSATGIDLEEIKEVPEAMFRKIANREEWALCTSNSYVDFFRFWTAKEAVLKAAGVGMKGLSSCRIQRIGDERHVTVDFRGRLFSIEQFQFQGHMAAVVDNGSRVVWSVDPIPPSNPSASCEGGNESHATDYHC